MTCTTLAPGLGRDDDLETEASGGADAVAVEASDLSGDVGAAWQDSALPERIVYPPAMVSNCGLMTTDRLDILLRRCHVCRNLRRPFPHL